VNVVVEVVAEEVGDEVVEVVVQADRNNIVASSKTKIVFFNVLRRIIFISS
jgi:hypothetical protein